MKRLKYKLHWNSSHMHNQGLKWVVYDWNLKTPIFYTETRKVGRLVCDLLNEINSKKY